MSGDHTLRGRVEVALRGAPLATHVRYSPIARVVEVCAASSLTASVVIRADASLNLGPAPGGLQLIEHLALAGLGGEGREAWLLSFAQQHLDGAARALAAVRDIGPSSPSVVDAVHASTVINAGAVADAQRVAVQRQPEAI